jgi:hypothetical protein
LITCCFYSSGSTNIACGRGNESVSM